MKKIIAAILFLLPFAGFTQTDILILQKNGRNIKTYAPGMPIMLHTVYDQWLSGTVTNLRNDSVFINNNPFHIKEIDKLRTPFSKLHLQSAGTVLIVAGVGVLALNVINGIYTNESAGEWIKASGWITAGALIITGIILRNARYNNYPIGKKYTLHYLNLRAPANPTDTLPKPIELPTPSDAH